MTSRSSIRRGLALLMGAIPAILTAQAAPPLPELPPPVVDPAPGSPPDPGTLDPSSLPDGELPPLPAIEDAGDVSPDVLAAYLGTSDPGSWVRFEVRVTSPEARLTEDVRVSFLTRDRGHVRFRVESERRVRPGRAGPGSGPLDVRVKELHDWDIALDGSSARHLVYDPEAPPSMAIREDTVSFAEAVRALPGLEGVYEPGRFTGSRDQETPMGRIHCRVYQRGSDLVWVDPDRPLGGLVRIKARDGQTRVDLVRLEESRSK